MKPTGTKGLIALLLVLGTGGCESRNARIEFDRQIEICSLAEDNGVLEELAQRGTGCVVATGHIGLFPVLGIPMVSRGLTYAPVARDPHDLRLKKAFDDSRTMLGYTNIPDRPATTVLKKSLRVLRGGGAVNITFDMRPVDGAIDVDFLGRRTPMYSAAVRLAASSRTPALTSANSGSTTNDTYGPTSVCRRSLMEID